MVQTKSAVTRVVIFLSYAVLSFMTIACLLPIIHTIALSFSDKAAAMAGSVGFWPVKFTTAAYRAILEDQQFWTSFRNSLFRVFLGVGVNMVLTILMAFPLSKNKRVFPQRNFYMWYLVFSMLFSGGLIPCYLLINSMGLLDSIWSLILPGAVPIFNIVILMNFFRGLPDELEEAARIDGANPWVILLRIFIPLAVPSIATVTLFCAVSHWNAFFDGIIYINSSSKLPLQSYMQQLVVEIRQTSTMSQEELRRMNELTSKNFNAAKVFVSMIPILLVYPFLQKYFVTGLVMGSVKG